jgi:hypothetical protein
MLPALPRLGYEAGARSPGRGVMALLPIRPTLTEPTIPEHWLRPILPLHESPELPELPELPDNWESGMAPAGAAVSGCTP